MHYQDDEEAQPPPPPSDEEEAPEIEPKPTPGQITPAANSAGGGHLRYEEVVYKDEFGNIIPEEQLSSMLAEQGDQIEFRTIYETQTKVLKPGEEPPPGAKRIPYDPNKEQVPKYPEGQNPETQ